MDRVQQVQTKQSEARQKLSALLDAETRDDGAIKQVTSELDSLETALQGALRLATLPVETREENTEGREMRQLEERANVGEFMDAVINHGQPSGAISELQQHYRLDANQLPMALLRRSAWDEIETRAVSPAPSNVGQNMQAIIPYVFPQSASAFMGIDVPVVGVGEAVFPVLTSELLVRTPAENAEADETTGTFSGDVLSPTRLQASFFYSREDRARFGGMDASLRENLSDGLADGLDNQIMAGTNGLLSGTNLANHNVTAVTTFDLYLAGLVYGRVDGRYASTSADLRLVVGDNTYGHAGRTYRNTTVDRTALDRMMEVTGGVRVSAHVPDAASNRQNVLIRRGLRRDMAAPIWDGVTFILDEVTKAKAGQIVITAVMMHAIKILRSDGFYKQQVQSA